MTLLRITVHARAGSQATHNCAPEMLIKNNVYAGGKFLGKFVLHHTQKNTEHTFILRKLRHL